MGTTSLATAGVGNDLAGNELSTTDRVVTGTVGVVETGLNVVPMGKAGGKILPKPKGSGSLPAPGPVNLMNASDDFLKNASKRSDVDPNGMLDVVAHGDQHVVQHGDEFLTPQGLADLLIQSDQFNGQAIRLLSCNTGAGGKHSFAQQLSDILRVDVVAPDNYLWAWGNGRLGVAGGTMDDAGRLLHNPNAPGTMVPFRPK